MARRALRHPMARFGLRCFNAVVETLAEYTDVTELVGRALLMLMSVRERQRLG